MAAMRCPIRFANDDMRMDLGCAVLKSDITRQREQLQLLRNGNFLVVLSCSVKETKHNPIECANSREMARQKALAGRKVAQTCKDFIALVEYESEGFLPALIDQFILHTIPDRLRCSRWRNDLLPEPPLYRFPVYV